MDDAGYLLYLERLDGAGPMTAEVAAGKASTAARTRRPTKFWEDRVKEPSHEDEQIANAGAGTLG